MAESIHHKIIIITAPSGAGKTSITRHLLAHFPTLAFSVSAATPSRPGQGAKTAWTTIS